MMSLTFGLFTQVSGSGPLGPLVLANFTYPVKVSSERPMKLEIDLADPGLVDQRVVLYTTAILL